MKGDEYWMSRAIELAKNGLGNTSPNPAVGSIIVNSQDEVIGEGWHHRAGEAHAERNAIHNALQRGQTDFSAATIYVTLEPCSTHGTTGACSDFIIKNRFKRVVYGSTDPNPSHVGKAEALFKANNIAVSHGILENQCDALIRGFSQVQRTGRPWVIAKTAMSLDGKITRPPTESQWLSNSISLKKVHELRATVDAIITGGETVRRDNPKLNVRLENYTGRQPIPVVLTRAKASLPATSALLANENTLIFETHTFEEVLETLAKEHGVNTVLLECGGTLMGEFFDQSLVNEVRAFLTPLLCGGEQFAVSGEGVSSLKEKHHLTEISFERLENDLMLTAVVTDEPSALSR